MNHAAPQPELRQRAIVAVRLASDRLARDPHALEGDSESAVTGAIAAACDEAGISPQDYRAVVDASNELGELERAALGEARSGGSTDPGPYAAISRESPSGKEGDTTKNRSRPPT